MNLLILCPYFLMVFAGLAIPSDGDHGIFSIKSLSFLTANLAVFIYAFLRQKISTYQLKLLLFVGGALCVLMVWMLISLLEDQTTSTARIDQFKLFLITISFPIATLYLISEGILTPQQLYKGVIYSSFLYAFLKVTLVAIHLLHLINIWSFIEMVGIRYMRMSIYGELERVQTSVDIATPFLVFFFLQGHKLGISWSRFFTFSYLLFTLLSTFLSFSRYLIFVYMLSCCLYWATLQVRSLWKVVVAIIITCCAAVYAIGPEIVGKIIERRIASKDNTESDETRLIQMRAMMQEIEQQPYIGMGIGGHAEGNIREPSVLHLYEVQWMAFLMQFGICGLLFLLTPLAFIGIKLIHAPFSRVRWSFLGLFLLWLFSGFTNPFLISLTSGIMYTLFYLSADVFKNSETQLLEQQA